MGILTYIRIGIIVALAAVAGYYVLNYMHLKKEVAILKVQVAEQKAALEFYEKAAKIDQETANVHKEITEAVNANDVQRVHDLYERLREHQRAGQSKAPSKAKPGRVQR